MVSHILLILHIVTALGQPADWGFYSHKLANRLAVFTLPSDLIGFYKVNIDYIEEHAVDADKRRYASPHEAVRHYIDLDRKNGLSPDSLGRSWVKALGQHIEVACKQMDSLEIIFDDFQEKAINRFICNAVLPVYYDETWDIPEDSIEIILDIRGDSCSELTVSEDLTEHGILPWNLISMQRRLTNAFKDKNTALILRLSADIGHYIGDAHVPLHTSENYNGQLTGQEGIHAFWESRVPELFADSYDLFTGRAKYIDDPEAYYWNIVLESHRKVDSVLMADKQLYEGLGEDKKYCFDQRGNAFVLIECEEFAKQFDEALGGMVERRLRKTIHAIGSAWYTAWEDAGSPELPRSGYIALDKDLEELAKIEQAYSKGDINGRPHPARDNE